MPQTHPRLNFLCGDSKRIPLETTIKEIFDQVTAADGDVAKLEIYVDGKPIQRDMEKSLRELYGTKIIQIFVGRKATIPMSPDVDKKLVQREIQKKCLSPSHVTRGYQG